MSTVTNVIVSGHAGCHPNLPVCRTLIDGLNEFLYENGFPEGDERNRLVYVSDYAGGTRALETEMWLGAINGLKVPEFIARYQDLCRDKIGGDSTKPQLFLNRQDDDRFHEIPWQPDGTLYHYLGVDWDVEIPA